MASTAVGNAELDRRPLILDEARELLIQALYHIHDDTLLDEITLWLEDYWKRYGKNAPRGSGRE